MFFSLYGLWPFTMNNNESFVFLLLVLHIRICHFQMFSSEVTVNYEENHMMRDPQHLNHSHMTPEEAGDGEVGSRQDEDIDLHQNFTETGGLDGEEYINVTVYNNMMNDTWLNLVSVMDLFTQRRYDNNSAIQALTAAFRYTHRQQKTLKMLPSYLKKPFIVIEGLDREKRNMLAKRLALHVQGHVVPNPPDTFEAVYRHLPPNETLVTNGFYVLSTYIAALHVRYVTQQTPAIIPGYWLGRAASIMAKNFIDRPPPFESKFWIWPRDLVKPDMVFYLTDRFSLHQFFDFKYVERYLKVFDNWDDPRCVPLVNTQSIDSMMEEIDPYLQQI